jgi:geranylgeranyl reductase family protein
MLDARKLQVAHSAMVTDIAIVGAGPAGALAAGQLARAGARVRLFDASHPREKPCGGGITRRAAALVASTWNPVDAPAVCIRSARFEAGPLMTTGATAADLPAPRGRRDPARVVQFPLHGPGEELVVVDRASFDGSLLAGAVSAGAVHVRERVIEVAPGPQGVDVRTRSGTTRASILVGADGAASLVRRRLTVPFGRSDLSMATGYFIRGLTDSRVVIRCLSRPAGYIWSFPRANHLAVGICAQANATDVATLRDVVRTWMAGAGIPLTAPLDSYSWPIPSLLPTAFDRQEIAGQRWMLLGDAAGLADPLTREGIYFALRSGELAAQALSGSGGCTRYETSVRDELYGELRRASQLKAGFFTSGFTELLVDALERSEAVREVMSDLIRGVQSYRGLARRLMGTLEVGLAWRLLSLELGSRLSA